MALLLLLQLRGSDSRVLSHMMSRGALLLHPADVLSGRLRVLRGSSLSCTRTAANVAVQGKRRR
jgi:hypothetical protein